MNIEPKLIDLGDASTETKAGGDTSPNFDSGPSGMSRTH